MSLVEPSDSLSVEQQQRIDQICLAFEDRWIAGKAPLIEPYAQQVDSLTRPALLRELLMVELEHRRAMGQIPQQSKYAKRFPKFESIVHAAFATIAQRDVALRFMPGQRIGRYEVRREIGTGAFGTVYQGWDEQLRRDVAIKVPRRSFACSEQTRKRLLDEARAIARLKHPGIVAVHDTGALEDGTLFLVMQYVDGQSLAQLLQSGRVPVDQAVDITIDIAEALACAHQAGLVHRDLKPGNILLDEHGAAHVADFGLALRESEQHLRAGEYAGTLAYMAPEQLQGQTQRMDGRADIWALGVLLYQMLSGKRPFRGANRKELVADVLQRDPKPLRQIDYNLPRALERVCAQCLARHAADRYSSAHDVAEALRQWQTRARSTRRNWSMAAALVLLGLIVAGSRFLPKSAQQSAAPDVNALAGSVDLQIWDAGGDDLHMIRLSDTDGKRPLRPYDKLRLRANVNRPSFLYVVWLDTRGTALPVYPWRHGDWHDRPTRERPISNLALPAVLDEAWTMGNDPPGMETLLLLARATPLPADVDLRHAVAALTATPLPARPALFWFQKGGDQPRTGRKRGILLDRLKAVSDPMLHLQQLIAEALGPHFGFIRAVSFPVSNVPSDPVP